MIRHPVPLILDSGFRRMTTLAYIVAGVMTMEMEESMSKEEDIKIEKLIAWDEYTTVNADKALPEIYEHAKNTSTVAREWYWSWSSAEHPAGNHGAHY